ncbi:SusC/RagA family TonB-linked outer membrane protein [Bacteroidota bacterium]
MRKHLLTILCLFLGMIQIAFAQDRQITGQVTAADDGSTYPGVTVLVPGTTIGTITDVDGNFTINVPENTTDLEFSYVGMKTLTISIEGRSVIDVQMEEDILGLEEVVVIGFGRQLKTDLTGSIAKVSTEDLNEVPTITIEHALQGVTSGVHIEQSSGKVGEATKVRIRGSSSISADNQPLYVVDGIPLYTENTGILTNHPINPLAQFNMADVETIEVLKDASAAAIYGSRAANGVIMITTKKGKAGKTNIDLNFSQGVSTRSNLVGFLNAAEYRELLDEAAQNGIDQGNPWGFIDIDDFRDWINTVIPGYREDEFAQSYDENWEEAAFRTGSVTNLDLSASGGSEKTSFFTGVSYLDQEGILINNRFRRASARLNLEHAAADRIKIGMNTMFSRTQMDRVSGDNAFSTPLQLVAQVPVTPIIDPNTGELNTNTLYPSGLIDARDNFAKNVAYRALGNAFFTWEPVKGITWRTDAGFDLVTQKEDDFQGRRTSDGSPDGRGGSRNVNILKFTTNNYVSFSKVIANNHSIEAVAGMTYENIERNLQSVQASGFPTDAFQTLASAANNTFYTSEETGFAYVSYFARANYKMMDKYLLGASVRRDGSSRFGKNSRYGTFPAFSAGWIMSRESFLQNAGFLSFLKLRASYGLTGNSGIDNFAHMGTYVGANYAGTSGIRPWTLSSPDLKWETTAQTDVGVDFGFFRNRINGEIDYYYKHTTDLLLARTLPASSGYTGVTQNIGSLENKGLEVVINTSNLAGEFKWNTSFNIAANKNKVLDIAGPDIIIMENRVRKDQPIGVFVTRHYAGVNPDNGHAWYYMEDGTKTEDYNLAPNLVVGSPNPDFIGGMTNSFMYKGFELNVLLSFVYGNSVYNGGGQYQSMQFSNWLDNQTKDQMNRWQKPGDVTDVPQAVFPFSDYSATNSSSRWLSDASYLRLKSVSLGYNLPAQVLQRLTLRSVKIYATGTNLFTWTKYKGWDPEVNYIDGAGTNQTRDNIYQGQDFYTAPQARTITVGIKIGI